MKKNIRLLVGSIILLLPYYSYSQLNPDSLEIFASKLGETFMKEKQAIGLSIGIYNNGNTYFYNFGTMKSGKSQVPTRRSVYEIGSITKTFVSYVLAQAVLDKKVSLEDDIRKYLKESYPNLEYNGHPIRLVHLANTTSLLPDWLPELPSEIKNLSPDSALTAKVRAYKNLSDKDFFAALHTVKLDTVPGTRRYHSNAAAQLLAYILEDVYQMPVDKLVKKFITGPAKMQQTSFIHSSRYSRLATGYSASGKESWYEFSMPYFKNAGGMASSTQDLVSYIGLLLDKDNPAAALCMKKTVDVNASSGKVVALRPDGVASPDIYSASLNWLKYQPDANASQVWADGGTNGFNSYLVMYPHLNSGVILLANKSDEKIFRALPGMAYQLSKFLEKK